MDKNGCMCRGAGQDYGIITSTNVVIFSVLSSKTIIVITIFIIIMKLDITGTN